MGQSKYRKALNATLVKLVEDVRPLSEKYQKQCSGPRNAYSTEIAQGITKKINILRQTAIDEIDESYKAYLERLKKKSLSITGADIDKADLALLESDLYTLNQEEFDVLQDKYEGNRSMERILGGYAEKKSDEYYKKTGSNYDEDGKLRLLSCRFLSDREKKNLAKKLRDEAVGWVDHGDSYSVADYVVAMAGDMFAAADKLKE